MTRTKQRPKETEIEAKVRNGGKKERKEKEKRKNTKGWHRLQSLKNKQKDLPYRNIIILSNGKKDENKNKNKNEAF